MQQQNKPKVTIGSDGTIHVDNDNNKPGPKVATNSVKTNVKNNPPITANKQASPEPTSNKPLSASGYVGGCAVTLGFIAIPFGLLTGTLPVATCGIIAVLVGYFIASPSKK